LYHHGPVLASFKWYNSFKVTKDGKLAGEHKGSYSYHAVVSYGYTNEGFLCQNSWGTGWGNSGRFLVPYTIKVVEARGFVDLDNDNEVRDLVEPKRTAFLDVLYKLFNFIINAFNNI
jgi:hypothetical protein